MLHRVLSVYLLLQVVIADKVSWCEYWYRRGIDRTECAQPKQEHWSLTAARSTQQNNAGSMRICDVITDWSRCQKSVHCPTGMLCWVGETPCCTPQIQQQTLDRGYNEGQCPASQHMGVQCNAKSAVSWCTVDSDCSRFNALLKCCPTGCGYNMCIRINQPIDIHARIAALSLVPRTCPAMDNLSVSCNMRSGVNWCYNDNQCYSTTQHKRICCPTRCGYNVCLLKMDANRWIIA